MTFRETKLILFTADLAGYARATAHMEALEVAAFLDGWYRSIDAILARHGARLVKYMGDAFLATFPEGAAVAAVDAAADLLALDHRASGLEVETGVKIHLGSVAEGEVGADRRYDIFGSAVNHLFRMGGAGVVLISEPVYLQLPDERRAAWQKHHPPATYSLAR
jgi:class 3 adenylate cyclase